MTDPSPVVLGCRGGYWISIAWGYRSEETTWGSRNTIVESTYRLDATSCLVESSKNASAIR